MTCVRYGSHALDDLERITEFLASHAFPAAPAIDAILDAIAVLERHPLIGRPVEGALRELVVSRGRTGYVVLYRWVVDADRVDVLAIRHQAEAGYA